MARERISLVPSRCAEEQVSDPLGHDRADLEEDERCS